MNEQNETKNTEEKEKKPVNWKSEIISWIQILVAAAAIAFVLNTFIIANSRASLTISTSRSGVMW